MGFDEKRVQAGQSRSSPSLDHDHPSHLLELPRCQLVEIHATGNGCLHRYKPYPYESGVQQEMVELNRENTFSKLNGDDCTVVPEPTAGPVDARWP